MFPFSSEVLNSMTNPNIQRPSRNTTSNSSSRNAFDSAPLSGHVTSASNMFFSAAANSFTLQQLCPSRNVPPMGNGNSSDPPPSFTEGIPAAPAGSFVQEWSPNLADSIEPGRARSTNGFRSSNNNSSVNGGQTLPRLTDLSEFPSLTSRAHGNSLPRSNAAMPEEQPHATMPEEQPHATMPKEQPHATMPQEQPPVGTTVAATSESTEFTMRNEDFPALPGTQPKTVSERMPHTPSVPVSRTTLEQISDQKPTSAQISDQKLIIRGDSFQPEQVIRAAPTDPTELRESNEEIIKTLSVKLGLRDPRLDDNVNIFGLDMNSRDDLYPSFGGVWSEGPCRPQDVDYIKVPPEYLVQSSKADKLPPRVKITGCTEQVLFHLFYNYTGDVLQIVAASELYQRGWRYHIEKKFWIMQHEVTERTSTSERGAYFYYDPTLSERRTVPQFHVEYSKIESQPIVPPTGYSYQ